MRAAAGLERIQRADLALPRSDWWDGFFGAGPRYAEPRRNRSIEGGVDGRRRRRLRRRVRRRRSARLQRRRALLRRAELRSGDPSPSARAARDRSLEIHALVLGEHNHGGIADADATVAEAAAEDVRTAIAWAAELGAGVDPRPVLHARRARRRGRLRSLRAAFASLCPVAAERGVTLCFEGLLPASEIRLLAERVGSPAFGCYFDLANPLRRGLDSPTEIRALGELVRARPRQGRSVSRRATSVRGWGRVDFARVRPRARRDRLRRLADARDAARPAAARRRATSASRARSSRRSSACARRGRGSARSRTSSAAASGTRSCRDSAGSVSRPSSSEASSSPSASTDPGRRRIATRPRSRSAGISVAALAGYRNLDRTRPGGPRRRTSSTSAAASSSRPQLGTWVVATETGTRRPARRLDRLAGELGRRRPGACSTMRSRRSCRSRRRSGTILALEATVKNVLRTQSQLHRSARPLPDAAPPGRLRSVQLPLAPPRSGTGSARPASSSTRFEDRFVLAHLKDVDPGGAEVATPEFGTGVFAQRPYLEFLRDRRPDLDLIVEHLPLGARPGCPRARPAAVGARVRRRRRLRGSPSAAVSGLADRTARRRARPSGTRPGSSPARAGCGGPS